MTDRAPHLSSDKTVHVFVGPTLTAREVRSVLPAATVHPPIRHGDLFGLRLSEGDRVLIVDGLFHHAPAIRHKEILWVIERGVQVVGAASMGALRAAELSTYGMDGMGWVYSQYQADAIRDDDEVAVAHTRGPEYRQLSVPLVNFRYALTAAFEAGVISSEQREWTLLQLRAEHYPRRSWQWVENLYERGWPVYLAGLEQTRRLFRSQDAVWDVKKADALMALNVLRTGDLLHRAVHPALAGDSWKTTYLAMWKNAHHKLRAEASGDEVRASLLDVIRYAQIFQPDFKERWASFVTQRSSGPLVPEELIPSAGADYWCTPSEVASLSESARKMKAYVRAFDTKALTCGSADDCAPLVENWVSVLQRVALARAVDSEMRSTLDGWEDRAVSEAALIARLCSTWSLAPNDNAGLEAASRDRGFRDSGEALAAAERFFFLALAEEALS
ncbi:MAG TPA: TfuA-like protein [Micromonosporaceae bacterium]